MGRELFYMIIRERFHRFALRFPFATGRRKHISYRVNGPRSIEGTDKYCDPGQMGGGGFSSAGEVLEVGIWGARFWDWAVI